MSRTIEQWEAHGVKCRTVWGPGPWVNGYCQLPEGHPARGMKPGDPGLNDALIVDVHGELTYGPDTEGWVGFDTAHGWDFWPEEELKGHKYSTAYTKLRDLIRHDPDRRTWTMEAMRREVEYLARQLREGSDADGD